MNDRLENSILDDARFDRLVDGELSAAEYQALLTALDDEPGGWRRCAMAFLEAQAWRSELIAVRSSPAAASVPRPRAAASARPWRRWLPLLAIAASFAGAFFSGLLAQREFDRHMDNSLPIVQRPVRPSGPAAGGNAPGRHELPANWQESGSIGNIRLVMDGGQGDDLQKVDVPVYRPNDLGAEWLASERSALTDDVVESLRRRGRKVERQIEYLPLPLDDQHEIVLPVEQIQITPVGRRSY